MSNSGTYLSIQIFLTFRKDSHEPCQQRIYSFKKKTLGHRENTINNLRTCLVSVNFLPWIFLTEKFDEVKWKCSGITDNASPRSLEFCR